MIEYYNGNELVTLFRSGTKIRIPISQERPKRFETCDLKITDYCDAGCAYCHENSTVAGTEANFEDLKKIVNLLEPYTEIAIGGGNPLSYLMLRYFLQYCKEMKMIPSITVNSFHINDMTIGLLNWYLENDLLYNVGISYNKNFYDSHKLLNRGNIMGLPQNKIVYHLIYGINDIPELVELYDLKSVLILGYKFHGRGKKGNGLNVINNLPDPEKLKEYIFSTNIKWCFDTLAVEQLGMDKESIYYMGDEGTTSCYIDMVKGEVALSSYSEKRFPIKKEIKNPGEFFNYFKNVI